MPCLFIYCCQSYTLLIPGNSNLSCFCEDPEQRLQSGYSSYKLSLQIAEDRKFSAEDIVLIYKRLGNCCNELGKHYMDKASQLYTKNTGMLMTSRLQEILRPINYCSISFMHGHNFCLNNYFTLINKHSFNGNSSSHPKMAVSAAKSIAQMKETELNTNKSTFWF